MDILQTNISQPSVPVRINLNIDQVKKIAFDLYDINVVKIKELNGYDDKNYLINDEFILKIINSIDSQKPEIFEAQCLLLEYLGKIEINCPKPVKTNEGAFFETCNLSSGNHIVRVLKYIDGLLLVNVPCSSRLLYQIGQNIAFVDNAMKDFDHPAYKNYKSLWMLESVPLVLQYVDAVKDERLRNLVKIIINKFIECVLPVSKSLPKGLIHGDLNEQNIIVEEKDGNYAIKAIIDYGDSHIGCYLYELAISMTYMIIFAKDIKAGGPILSGYRSVKECTDIEYSLLKLCIASRFCQSLVLGAYTNQQDANNTYVLTTAEYGWPLLKKLWNHSDEELLKMWKSEDVNKK